MPKFLVSNAMKSASIYRFGESVAMHLPVDGTCYLTAADARRIARALNAAARNIAAEPKFSHSTFGTIEVPLSNNGERR